MLASGNFEFYIFSHFVKTGLVVHGFTSRAGGVSGGPFAGLNTAFHVGDGVENVLANRALACAALGMDHRRLVAGRQVHGDRIEVVGMREAGRGALSHEDALPDTDALVTGTPGVPLASFYADCVPIFLLDPGRRVVALAHAGWKGTVLKIGLKTVQKMAAVFGSDPADCLGGIGPSIGPCCYEVDGRVMEPFRKSFAGFREFARAASPGKWYLDLWEANRHTLLEAGLREKNITVARICTSCRNDLFFSHRAQGGTAGRMAALIMLKG